MTQFRERTLVLLAYKDAITKGIGQGITKSVICRALKMDAGIDITVKTFDYYREKYLNEDIKLDIPQLPLPSLYRPAGAIAPSMPSIEHVVSPSLTTLRPSPQLPSPLPSGKDPTPPPVVYDPPYKNIYKIRIEEQGPMTDWIPLEDGAKARWGFWRRGSSPSVKFDCEIESPVQSVFLALAPGGYVNMYFPQENVGAVDMDIIKRLLGKSEKMGKTPDDLLDEIIAIKIGHIETVKRYHDWYLEQKANAKEY